MKLYTANAPNPRRLHMYLLEKDLKLERVPVDIFNDGARAPELLAKNALGALPILELDDGAILTESHAICLYLEALHPEPALFGRSALERAQVEMWNRRFELEVLNTVIAIGKHSAPFFATRLTQVPAFADAQRHELARKFEWLDQEFADGRPFIVGEHFSVADITAMVALRLAEALKVSPPANLEHLGRYEQTLRTRPSWNA